MFENYNSADVPQHELNCHACIITDPADGDCRRCYYSQVPAIHDPFFRKAVRPYCWFAAVLLFLSYIIGLWFTLRTHAAVIWNAEIAEHQGSISHHPTQLAPVPPPKHQGSGSSRGSVHIKHSIHETAMFKTVFKQTLQNSGLSEQEASRQVSSASNAYVSQSPNTPHLVPPKKDGEDNAAVTDGQSQRSVPIFGLPENDDDPLTVRQVAQVAASAATFAAENATHDLRKASAPHSAAHHTPRKSTAVHVDFGEAEADAMAAGGGHDAPNWSRAKSAVILLGATLLYAVIAEILVDTVDVVLQSVDIDEKFLGITLFALVPNTTEFLVRTSPFPSTKP